MDIFNENRFYRVVEKKDRQGKVAYCVEATDSKLALFLNVWDQYVKENDSLEEAIEQIETIDKHKVVSKKTVYRVEKK